MQLVFNRNFVYLGILSFILLIKLSPDVVWVHYQNIKELSYTIKNDWFLTVGSMKRIIKPPNGKRKHKEKL